MTICDYSDSTNQYFDVAFELAVRVICSFRNDPGNQIQGNKSCSITYGPCNQQEASAATMTGTSSDSTVVINLQSQLSNGDCYTVIASNGDALSTVKIQGVFSEYTPVICDQLMHACGYHGMIL